MSDPKIIRLELTIGEGEGRYTKIAEIDNRKVPLKVMMDIETAQESGKWTPLYRAYGRMFGLTLEEMGEMTNEQFTEITAAFQQAVKEQTAIPNG